MPKNNRGVSFVEYALVVGVFSVTVVSGASLLRGSVSDLLQAVESQLSSTVAFNESGTGSPPPSPGDGGDDQDDDDQGEDDDGDQGGGDQGGGTPDPEEPVEDRTVIQGSPRFFETIYGSSGDDEIRTGGGSYDYIFGGEGADNFVIEQSDRHRDFVYILDYEPGLDEIDLSGREVFGIQIDGSYGYVYLESDFDTIIVSGVSTSNDITFR